MFYRQSFCSKSVLLRCVPSYNTSSPILIILIKSFADFSRVEQIVYKLGPNGSLRKPEQEPLKKESSTAISLPALPSHKADYADELFKTLCMTDSVDNGSSPDMSTWVRFDCTVLTLTLRC